MIYYNPNAGSTAVEQRGWADNAPSAVPQFPVGGASMGPNAAPVPTPYPAQIQQPAAMPAYIPGFSQFPAAQAEATSVPLAPSGSSIPGVPLASVVPSAGYTGAQPGSPIFEQSYIENILRLNLGKVATLYMTYENNSEWNAKIFRGVLEAAGRDHIIISDPQTCKRYLLLMVNLDYIVFDEELNYISPFQQGQITGPLPPGQLR